MKLSWFFVLLLLVLVAVFSVQNAGPISVRFLAWEFSLSAALAIQLAALLGGLVGIAVGLCSRRAPKPVQPTPATIAPAPARNETTGSP